MTRLRSRGESSESLLAMSADDPEMFGAVYNLHADRLLGFLRKRTSNAEVAFDLFAETFAKALERRRQFRGTTLAEEQAWLFAIARSELLHYWREQTTEASALERLGIMVPSLIDPDIERIDELGDRFDDAEIRRAVERLPTASRQAVERRFFDGADYSTLAAEFGISAETARTRVSRGLRALAEALAPIA